MYLKDTTEKIFEGIKIIPQHFQKEKEIKDDSIIYLQTSDIKNNSISIEEKTSFVKETTFQKYYNYNLKNIEIQYGDVLFDSINFQLLFFETELKNRIIPCNDFIVFRPTGFLKSFLNDANGKKHLIEEISKVFKSEYQDKIELVKKIYIPNDFSELEEIFYERPDKKLVNISLINIKQGLMTLDKILKRITFGEINVETANYFQRRGNLWNNDVKSRFIEALIVRQPVPAFYFDATNDDKWLIVDGLQRLSAVKEFVLEKEYPLRLSGLYYLPDKDYNNKTFAELPRAAQRNIEEYEIIAYRIEPPTPKEVKYKIFKSINVSALTLSNQEIRHALNHKINETDLTSPAEYVKELSEIPIFEKLIKTNKISNERMLDREIVLRYIAFRIIPYENYSPLPSEFLDNAMTAIYRVSEEDLMKYKVDFGEALFCIDKIYGENAFRKSMFGLPEENFIYNLFESWTYAFSIITDKHREILLEKKAKIREQTKELIKDKKFLQTIDVEKAYTIEGVRYRFTTVKNFVLNFVK